MIAENLAMYASDADASEGKPIGKYKGDRESVDQKYVWEFLKKDK